jgi:hypothetical protein
MKHLVGSCTILRGVLLELEDLGGGGKSEKSESDDSVLYFTSFLNLISSGARPRSSTSKALTGRTGRMGTLSSLRGYSSFDSGGFLRELGRMLEGMTGGAEYCVFSFGALRIGGGEGCSTMLPRYLKERFSLLSFGTPWACVGGVSESR